ncbi:MurR/RpiR family transcriptional regulator [Bacillus massiliigorillae]|uniref:MurR/RpiR family transcriptional regulator n=1 Tax=Bacillus massiliigorillae TaxID=1243664 RepID=UPI0003A4D2D8|nr:MurR/RpiR family transcriptional regulator [Bacillus massiliigorillae]
MDLQGKVKNIFADLSNSQKKVAKYLLDHPQKFAVHSASEIGKEVGVSETTIIRFCYSLQLKGYSELQKQIRNSLIFENSSLNEYYSSKKQVADQPNFFAEVMEQDIASIQRTIANLSEKDFTKAVSKLTNSDYVLISGHRLSFSAAHWLTFTLRLVRENVCLYKQDTDDLFLLLNKLTENSVFVAISFHRYVKETLKITEMAKEAGAYVIAITDSELAPIAEFADLMLPISKIRTSTIDTAPVLFSLCNALVAGVSIQDEDRFTKRKAIYDSFNTDDFFL